METSVQVIMPAKKAINVDGSLIIPKKKVCAYCRVSTDELDQLNSINMQRDEFRKRILENPDWELVKIYADEGISGTDIKHRDSFNEMMADARSGKIDWILTKSISRFGRNTLNTINSIRELKKLGVYVKFETEGISTDREDCEFILTMMASMAQEEARHTSVNVKWNVEKRMKEGVPIFCHTTFLGYTKDPVTKKIVIVPEEAKIIKEIYELYTTNVGPNEICRIMERKGYKTGRGKTHWCLSYVQSILKNEKYCGDLLQQKTVTTDFLSHKREKNKNIAPMYYIKDNHEAIIPRDMWDLAQKIRLERLKTRVGGNPNLKKYLNKYPYSGLLMCGDCGSSFKRRYWNYGYASQRIVMQCSKRINDMNSCRKCAIDLKILEEATRQVVVKFFKANKGLFKDVKDAFREGFSLTKADLAMKELEQQKAELAEQMSQLIDLKLKAKNPTEAAIYDKKYDEYLSKMDKLNDELNHLELSSLQDNSIKRFDAVQKKLKEFEDGNAEYDGEFLNSLFNKIIVIDQNNVVYLIPKDRVYTDAEIKMFKDSFIKQMPIIEGQVKDTRGYKIYTINYRAVII